MILRKTNNEFVEHPWLTDSLPDDIIQTTSMKEFDKDGYEITCDLERFFYRVNDVDLNWRIQKHSAPVKQWFYDEEDSEEGLVIDHSMVLTRWVLKGQALEDVTRLAKHRPILNKLIGIEPKWGVDFSLDWIDNKGCVEVIHFEKDFKDYSEAVDVKHKFEEKVMSIDWEDGVKRLLERKDEWINLVSDDHSDYKAKFFGWDRAFDSYKVFTI